MGCIVSAVCVKCEKGCFTKHKHTHKQSRRFQSGIQFSACPGSVESPAGSPVCSVHAADGNSALHYRCEWPGGTPEAQLTFPALSTASMGLGELNLTVDDPLDLDGMEVSCLAHHPVHQKQCNITARKCFFFLLLLLGFHFSLLTCVHTRAMSIM